MGICYANVQVLPPYLLGNEQRMVVLPMIQMMVILLVQLLLQPPLQQLLELLRELRLGILTYAYLVPLQLREFCWLDWWCWSGDAAPTAPGNEKASSIGASSGGDASGGDYGSIGADRKTGAITTYGFCLFNCCWKEFYYKCL